MMFYKKAYEQTREHLNIRNKELKKVKEENKVLRQMLVNIAGTAIAVASDRHSYIVDERDNIVSVEVPIVKFYEEENDPT